MNFGITIMDLDHKYNLLNDGTIIDRTINNSSNSHTYNFKWKVPNFSNRKLAMVATLNKGTGDDKQIVAFIGEDAGASFIIDNKNSKSKALLADKGVWSTHQ